MVKIFPQKTTLLPNIQSAFKHKIIPRISQDKNEIAVKDIGTKILQCENERLELVNLFMESFTHTYQSYKKKNVFLNYITKLNNKILSLPIKLSMNLSECINEGIKQNGKLIGGYSLHIDYIDKIAYINIMAVSSKLKGTKTSAQMLITMAERIRDIAKQTEMNYITWTTSKTNRPIELLLSRFNAQKEPHVFGEIDSKISVDDFSKVINNLFNDHK